MEPQPEPSPSEALASSGVLHRNVYASSDWWNERFKTEGKRTFDWYVTLKELKVVMESLHLSPQARILVVGCGNSRLSFELHKAGYRNIVNIDISGNVIQTMKEISAKEGFDTGLEWLEMDATKTSFGDSEFDLVIDKGTLDAVLCGDDYTIPNNLLKEMNRVTKVNAPVLLVTHSAPANRKFLFEWNFSPKDTRIYYGQVELSPEINMLNIFRSIGKQKSLSEIIKDSALFAECMAAVQKDTKQRMVIRKLKEGSQLVNVCKCWYKEAVTARIQEKNKKKAALLLEQGIVEETPQQIELFKCPGFEHLPFEKMDISVSSISKSEAASQGIEVGAEFTTLKSEAEVLTESEASGVDKATELESGANNVTEEECQPKKKTIVKVRDSGYNPPRQDHCFVYLVYKTG